MTWSPADNPVRFEVRRTCCDVESEGSPVYVALDDALTRAAIPVPHWEIATP